MNVLYRRMKQSTSNIVDFDREEEDVDLANKMYHTSSLQSYEDMVTWMRHYHEHLVTMYKVFIREMKGINITLLSFPEFCEYVYRNSERYIDPRLHKKVRPLV